MEEITYKETEIESIGREPSGVVKVVKTDGSIYYYGESYTVKVESKIN